MVAFVVPPMGQSGNGYGRGLYGEMRHHSRNPGENIFWFYELRFKSYRVKRKVASWWRYYRCKMRHHSRNPGEKIFWFYELRFKSYRVKRKVASWWRYYRSKMCHHSRNPGEKNFWFYELRFKSYRVKRKVASWWRYYRSIRKIWGRGSLLKNILSPQTFGLVETTTIFPCPTSPSSFLLTYSTHFPKRGMPVLKLQSMCFYLFMKSHFNQSVGTSVVGKVVSRDPQGSLIGKWT